MAYTPNTSLVQKNLTTLTFKDNGLLAVTVSSETSYSISMYDSDDSLVGTFDLLAAGFDASTPEYDLNPDDFGLASGIDFTDDLYKFVYAYNIDIGAGADSGNDTFYRSINGQKEEHLQEKLSAAASYINGSNLDWEYVKDILSARAFLLGAKEAAARGFLTEHSNINTALLQLKTFEDYNS